MTLHFVLSTIFLFFAIVILMGKRDMLIAGYNTASEEKRKRIYIRRLRLLITAALILTSILCLATPFINNNDIIGVAVLIFIIVLICIVILANTWAKKK